MNIIRFTKLFFFVRKNSYQSEFKRFPVYSSNTFRKIKLVNLYFEKSAKNMTHNLFNTRRNFQTGSGEDGVFYSLPQLEKEGIGTISRLPISIRIVLESVLRNFDDGKKVSEANIRALAGWGATDERTEEIPFTVARVILQDFTGVPLLG